MQIGTVKWFDIKKNFGFIQPQNGGRDVFVHTSALSKSGLQELQEGQTVEFDTEINPKNNKQNAINIKIVS